MRDRTDKARRTVRRRSARLSILLRIGLPLWLAVTAAAAASVPVPVPLPSTGDRIRAGGAASERGDCDEADRQLRPLTQAQGSAASKEARTFAYVLLVSCRARAGENERAYADALAGTGLGSRDDYLWRARLFLEIETKRPEAAVATMEAVPAAEPSLFAKVEASSFYDVDQQLKEKNETPLRERLLKRLMSEAWTPASGPSAKDAFRIRYARLLLAHAGGEAEARTRIAEVSSPYWLRQVSVDPKLRALRAGDIDIRAATEARLKLDQEAVRAEPDRLRPLLSAAADLRALGRPDEAFRLLQTVAARVEQPHAFTDGDDHLAWWWDEVGRSYEALGKYDEAVAAFRRGTTFREGHTANISQVINLAIVQTRFGHAKDALTTLAVFHDPKRTGSPYGEMTLRDARGCANAVLGEKGALAADLAYAKAHEKDSRAGLTDLLLCAGDLDGAAAVVIRRLADPDERSAALLDLSDYADRPVPLPPSPSERALAALKARPDVKAAIEAAGGTRRFNVPSTDL